MELYNKLIERTAKILENTEVKKSYYSDDNMWPTTQKSQLIMMREAGFELGGSGRQSVNYTCFTDNQAVINKDEILLYGPDLTEISTDCAFARIALVTVKKNEVLDDDARYLRLKNIEFAKYHVFPKGYMMRLSPDSFREQVRVSKESLSNGISFFKVGNNYINEYKKNPDVVNVRLIFVTCNEVDFRALMENAYKADKIISTLSSIFNGMQTDCGSCELKEICDEVEGLRQLHFGLNKKERSGDKNVK